VACGNDEALYRRVLPWPGWCATTTTAAGRDSGGQRLRHGRPDAARTGTHYTPRSLTEPIVQHTLEPLVYVGPAEGWPREKWRLRTPAEILALKVCDMAMGSGAFLVQADRYLAERLVEAWDAAQQALNANPQASIENRQSSIENRQSLITPEGAPTDDPDKAIPADPEEQVRLARRLVADRCLYGVDKNPLAVEMAKLSLWLVTLDKNRPFTFLDHALRHGDSLIGADEELFLRWAHGLRDAAMPLFDQEIRALLAEAQGKRQALQAFEVRDVHDAEEKARLLAEAEAATARIKLGCDLLVGARLLDDLNQSGQDALLANGLLDYVAGKAWQDPDAARAVQAAQALPAFHWPFEFPEVFAGGGFNAFVGNPPFLGGAKISGTFGDGYLKYLLTAPQSNGNADLCSFFFRRVSQFTGIHGIFGLIATNSISQGATRDNGLKYLVQNNHQIIRARKSAKWPGSANVHISIVIVYTESVSTVI
jgi:hypothetical protein